MTAQGRTDLSIPFDNSYAKLPERFFAKLDPKPVEAPKLLKFNDKLAKKLGLDGQNFTNSYGVSVLAGNQIAPGSEPLAMAYAGQQFGSWNPQLGDGRAHLLGEILAPSGDRFDIQLKGSGPTPFSRMGDGRAWLGPVMREYIVSEAMAALGVPTTRALAAVTTGETIVREAALPGAILTRVSRAHIRVGTFQYFAARKDWEGLSQLTKYTLERLYPGSSSNDNTALTLLLSVIKAQTELIARWMSFGFIHGVMNTDNVSIAGETIDYGPCAFMDDFHPDRVFSSIDEGGRYAYSNQPRIGHWNMVQFAQALLPILDDDEEAALALAQEAVNSFPDIYMSAYNDKMNAKLGFEDVRDGDAQLVNDLLKIMAEQKADFTNTFRHLASSEHAFLEQFSDRSDAQDWLLRWKKRCASDGVEEAHRVDLMNRTNPAFIPRNHRIEQAIRAALEEDFEPFERLLTVLERPFDEQTDETDLMAPPAAQEMVHYTFCGT